MRGSAPVVPPVIVNRPMKRGDLTLGLYDINQQRLIDNGGSVVIGDRLFIEIKYRTGLIRRCISCRRDMFVVPFQWTPVPSCIKSLQRTVRLHRACRTTKSNWRRSPCSQTAVRRWTHAYHYVSNVSIPIISRAPFFKYRSSIAPRSSISAVRSLSAPVASINAKK